MTNNTKQDDTAPELKTELKSEAISSVSKLEGWLEGINKQLPQIPKKGRDVIAQLAPWLALAGGILTLLSSWWFWRAGHAVNQIIDISNNWSRMYGGPAIEATPNLGFTWYFALVLLVLQAVLLLAAFPKLKEGKKTGWDLLFYNALLAAFIGIVYLFTPGYGFGGLFGSFIGTAIGLYLLFQARDHFAKK